MSLATLYMLALFGIDDLAVPPWIARLIQSVYAIINTVWWGLALGIMMISFLGVLPREMVLSLVGRAGTVSGIFRAVAAGVLLDLCSHGILMVGGKLYERGVSTAQVMAFLIASPWNSFSLTLVLIAMIGYKWTLLFIAGSMLIAVVSGVVFMLLEDRGFVPANPYGEQLPVASPGIVQAWKNKGKLNIPETGWPGVMLNGIKESRMILRWILLGILLAAFLRAVFPEELFGAVFGPTLAGLGLTLLAATIVEVCSEGSSPIAADLLTRAQAPGNSFAFLMAGVSTDYTEFMVIREVTRSWKIALLLPVITLPQVVLLAWLMNSV